MAEINFGKTNVGDTKTLALEQQQIAAKAVRSLGRAKLRELETPKLGETLISGCLQVAWIFVAAALPSLLGTYATPFSLLILGSRQRALSNFVHDAAHGNLARSRKLNDWLGNGVAGYPMGETVASYRKSHGSHHRHLGQPTHDPDLRKHEITGFDDHRPPSNRGVLTWLKLLFNQEAWIQSMLGDFPKLDWPSRMRVLSFWLLLCSSLYFLLDGGAVLQFTGLWLIARATTYHAIRVVAEFLDHSGLRPGTIIGYTRNMPATSPLSRVFHPLCDTFHLAHHLFPKTPHYKLARLHALLIDLDIYQPAHQCDGYFLGEHPAFKCWSSCNPSRSTT